MTKSIDRGYKGLAIKLTDAFEPRLHSPQQDFLWKPGKNISSFEDKREWHRISRTYDEKDLRPSEKKTLEEEFRDTHCGIYCLDTPNAVANTSYWTKTPKISPILAQIAPHGYTSTNERGWRSSEATITELYMDEALVCNMCKVRKGTLIADKPGTVLTHSWALCPKCYKYLGSKTTKGSLSEPIEISKIGTDLQEYYQVPLLPVQKHWRE